MYSAYHRTGKWKGETPSTIKVLLTKMSFKQPTIFEFQVLDSTLEYR
jgi:hypothetical protein